MDTEADRRHPAPYPVELPKRLVKFYSFPEQTILDPFLGSGTTMKACLELKRNSIGIELNPEYVEMARRRLGYCNVSVEKLGIEKFNALDNHVVIDSIRYTLPNRIP